MKAKIINAPETIYLQVGDFTDETVDYGECYESEMTWSNERIYECDVEYRLVKRRRRLPKSEVGKHD